MPRPADPTLRDRLIAAATAEFAEGGYAGSTLEAIAARAGVTKGGLYFHFAGKEELFFAVLDHWREHRRRELQVQVAADGGAAGALRQFLAGYLAFHLREPAATRLLRVLSTELRGRFTARLR
ncbi:MAG: TetR/AcrR family transcriptional regulator, partial [Planctomycetes bacterium]|nr:TetR/AcrR family transcriptional regulator [Planctomycetota bacterium]